uniref:transglycosylase SLT domain-containing protein n=1 Tax=Acinetobacter sp. P8-3-8 TaxID=1029823 RepID=UPI0002487E45
MAAASLGRLTLDLAVKLGSFEQGMTQAERKTKQTTDNMNKAFAGFKDQVADALGGTQLGSIVDSFNTKIGSLSGGIGVASAALAGMVAGGTVLAVAGLSKMAIETAKANNELQVLANRANTSIGSFQVLQYAAEGLGVSQDQLGSILADTQEKLGEFSATKGGGAADFFDALKNNTKMTESQIKSFGKTLQGKDGIEAIQMLNDKMDELGVTSQERRFIFESLASDLANLAPIFAENGKALDAFDLALQQAGLKTTKEAAEQSQLLAAQVKAVNLQFQGWKNQLVSGFMPAIIDVANAFFSTSKNGQQLQSVGSGIGSVMKAVAKVALGVSAAFTIAGKIIGGVAAAIAALKGDKIATVNMMFDDIEQTLADYGNRIDSFSIIGDSATKSTNDLVNAILDVNSAAQQSAKGLALDTKTADENAKAKEKAAKETEKLNKQLQVNAKVQSNAAKYNFAGIEGQYQLPKGLLSAINMQESRGNANAIGPMTKYGQAKGGFQFLDGTAKRFGLIGNAVFDTGKSAEAAAKYFQSLYQKFGTWEKAISAYHAGEGNVERGTGLGPINREYVKNVLGYMDAALKGVGTTAADAVKYVEEVYKSQRSIVLKYLNEQERMELDHSVSIQEIKDAFAENDPSREKYLKLQQLAYQKDVAEFRKAQQQKRDAAFASTNNPIGDMIGMGVEASARASMNPEEYQRWQINNEQQDGYSQLGDDLYSARSGIENNEFLSETEKYAQLNDAYKVYLDSKKALTEEYNAEERALDQEQFETKMQVYSQIAGMTAQTFDQMAGMLRDSVGESNALYKTMFLAGKAASIAQAIVNTEEGATKALAQGGAYGSLLAGVVRATGYASVGLIAGQTIAGMAHDGIDNIPKEGTWLLDKGERVVDSRTNADLKGMIANQKNGSGDVNISVHVTDSGVTTQSNQSDQ